jgi:hypothetical protein
VGFDAAEHSMKYVNTKLFPKPSFPPDLLMEITYEVQNEVLLCKYTYFALEPEGLDLYGSESEVVIIDSFGNEIGRVTVEGNLNSVGITEDNKFLYLSTGGQINEDASHPFSCLVYDLNDKKSIYSRRAKSNECIGCGAIKNYGIMTINESCSKSFQLLDLWIFDHQSNKIYKPDMIKQCPKYSEVRFFEEYCICHNKDGTSQKFYYKNDFTSQEFVKK